MTTYTHHAKRPAFFPPESLPWLAEIQPHWPAIREEARRALAALEEQLGDETGGPSWILPLVPEPEDEHVFKPEVLSRARELSPVTVGLMAKAPAVAAYAFAKLAAGTHIPEHDHWNPYFTAMLCLQDGGGSHLIVNGERRDFKTGAIVLFDYTLPHEVRNTGHEDRLVLLMLVPRSARVA
jgi:aspartyl/asparaginyl beta-hydroxylase (cupin superfamily)